MEKDVIYDYHYEERKSETLNIIISEKINLLFT